MPIFFLSFPSLKPGFLNIDVINILVWVLLLERGCPVHYRFSNVPGFYLLDVNRILNPSCGKQISPLGTYPLS
jgi:hypothetical protein